jgi:hypothetical protein
MARCVVLLVITVELNGRSAQIFPSKEEFDKMFQLLLNHHFSSNKCIYLHFWLEELEYNKTKYIFHLFNVHVLFLNTFN